MRKFLELTVKVLETEPMSEERNALYEQIQDVLDRARKEDLKIVSGLPPEEKWL